MEYDIRDPDQKHLGIRRPASLQLAHRGRLGRQLRGQSDYLVFRTQPPSQTKENKHSSLAFRLALWQTASLATTARPKPKLKHSASRLRRFGTKLSRVTRAPSNSPLHRRPKFYPFTADHCIPESWTPRIRWICISTRPPASSKSRYPARANNGFTTSNLITPRPPRWGSHLLWNPFAILRRRL